MAFRVGQFLARLAGRNTAIVGEAAELSGSVRSLGMASPVELAQASNFGIAAAERAVSTRVRNPLEERVGLLARNFHLSQRLPTLAERMTVQVGILRDVTTIAKQRQADGEKQGSAMVTGLLEQLGAAMESVHAELPVQASVLQIEASLIPWGSQSDNFVFSFQAIKDQAQQLLGAALLFPRTNAVRSVLQDVLNREPDFHERPAHIAVQPLGIVLEPMLAEWNAHVDRVMTVAQPEILVSEDVLRLQRVGLDLLPYLHDGYAWPELDATIERISALSSLRLRGLNTSGRQAIEAAAPCLSA